MDDLVDKLKMVPSHFLIGGAILLAGLYYFVYFDPGDAIQKRIDKDQVELEKVQKSLAETEAVIGDRSKFEAEYNQVSDQFRAAIEYLPSDFNMQSLLRQIYSEARSAGIGLERTKPHGSDTKKPPAASAKDAPAVERFYEEILIDVTLVGTYSQLTLFMSYMSRVQRIVNIRDINLKYERQLDQTPFLKMTGTLVSYRYLEGR